MEKQAELDIITAGYNAGYMYKEAADKPLNDANILVKPITKVQEQQQGNLSSFLENPGSKFHRALFPNDLTQKTRGASRIKQFNTTWDAAGEALKAGAMKPGHWDELQKQYRPWVEYYNRLRKGGMNPERAGSALRNMPGKPQIKTPWGGTKKPSDVIQKLIKSGFITAQNKTPQAGQVA